MWPVQEAVHSVSEPTSRYTGSQHGLLQLQIVSIGLTCGTGLFNKFHSSRNHCSPRESRLSLFLSSRPTLLDTATFTRSLDNIFGYVAITKVLINLKGGVVFRVSAKRLYHTYVVYLPRMLQRRAPTPRWNETHHHDGGPLEHRRSINRRRRPWLENWKGSPPFHRRVPPSSPPPFETFNSNRLPRTKNNKFHAGTDDVNLRNPPRRRSLVGPKLVRTLRVGGAGQRGGTLLLRGV